MTEYLVRHKTQAYFISTDQQQFDFEKIHAWLSTDYWAEGIPKNLVIKSFANSLSFGLFHNDEGQVGCARMITDYTTFSYLADVYVDPEHRGNGLGYWLTESVMAHPDQQDLRRIMLATSNMQPLYSKFGFCEPADPGKLMEKVRPDIYKVPYSGK